MEGVLPFLSKDFLNYAIIAASVFYSPRSKDDVNNGDRVLPHLSNNRELILSNCIFLVDENKSFLDANQKKQFNTLCHLLFNALIDIYFVGSTSDETDDKSTCIDDDEMMIECNNKTEVKDIVTDRAANKNNVKHVWTPAKVYGDKVLRIDSKLTHIAAAAVDHGTPVYHQRLNSLGGNESTPLRVQSLNNPFAFESPYLSKTMFSPLSHGKNMSSRATSSPQLAFKILTPQPSQSSSPVSIESTSPMSSPRVRTACPIYRGCSGKTPGSTGGAFACRSPPRNINESPTSELEISFSDACNVGINRDLFDIEEHTNRTNKRICIDTYDGHQFTDDSEYPVSLSKSNQTR